MQDKNKKIIKELDHKSERFSKNQESYEVLQDSRETPILAFTEMEQTRNSKQKIFNIQTSKEK